jgi:hypothetical protein
MTYAAPSFDFYDDGLVHSHDWSRNTPAAPGASMTMRLPTSAEPRKSQARALPSTCCAEHAIA